MDSLENITNKEIRKNNRVRNFFRAAVLGAGMFLGSILPSYGQHNVQVKTASLDHSATGTPIPGVVVSKDQGDVVQVTDANGEATLTDVNGTMSIRALHPDYKEFTQTFNITSDTVLYFAMPKNIRIGPWGVDTLNVTWFKNTFRNTLTVNSDSRRWKQVAPINNRLAPGQYSQADSLLVVDAIKILEDGTGYDLITLVPSSITKDTTYTIELNSYTNTSNIGYTNDIIFAGNSKIMPFSGTRDIIHEINNQFEMKPYPGNNVPTPGSVMDPDVGTMTDPNKMDFNHIALTFDQNYRKLNLKQNLFLSQMSDYIALSNVGIVSISSPLNGAVDVDTLLNILGSKDANAIWYDFKIASDALGNNVFLAQNGVDRPRIYADLEPGKTYFLFERARNNTSTGAWSTPVQITTKAKQLILPDQALIGGPLNGATKVGTPVPYSISSNNATSFRIIAARNSDLSQVLKDTIVFVTNPNIPLPHGTDVYTQVFGINANGTGVGSVIVHYTTIKDDPTNSSVLTPVNNATKVTQPVNFTNGESINAEQYRWRIRKHSNQVIVLDTLLNSASGFSYSKLSPGEMYDVTVQPINSDVNGNESAANIFTIIKDKPGAETVLTPTNNQTKVTQPFTYTNTSGTSSEQHRWQIRELDNTVKLDTLVSALQFIYDKLEPGKTYKVRVKGVNSDQEGDWSADNIYTIIKGDLNSILITSPLNNATEVTSPVNVTSTTGGQYTEGYKYEVKTLDDVAVLDTATLSNGFNKKFPGNKTLKVRGWAYNSDKEGTKSPWVIFTTFDSAPGNWDITGLVNNAVVVYVNKKLPISSTAAIDIDNDNVSKNFHVVGPDLDTLIHANNTETIYLDSARLKLDSEYTITGEATDGKKTTPALYIIKFKTPKATGVNDVEILRNNMVIYPNPNPNYIKFYQDIQGETDIDLINMSGQILRHVYNERQPPGDYLISIDKNGLASGFYLIRKTTKGTQKTQVETGKTIIDN